MNFLLNSIFFNIIYLFSNLLLVDNILSAETEEIMTENPKHILPTTQNVETELYENEKEFQEIENEVVLPELPKLQNNTNQNTSDTTEKASEISSEELELDFPDTFIHENIDPQKKIPDIQNKLPALPKLNFKTKITQDHTTKHYNTNIPQPKNEKNSTPPQKQDILSENNNTEEKNNLKKEITPIETPQEPNLAKPQKQQETNSEEKTTTKNKTTPQKELKEIQSKHDTQKKEITRVTKPQEPNLAKPQKQQETNLEEKITTKNKTTPQKELKGNQSKNDDKIMLPELNQAPKPRLPQPEIQIDEFIEKELKMLLLENDDIILGKMTRKAYLKYLDYNDYITTFWKKYDYLKNTPKRDKINKYIENYYENRFQ